jgi:hypothetical protein
MNHHEDEAQLTPEYDGEIQALEGALFLWNIL